MGGHVRRPRRTVAVAEESEGRRGWLRRLRENLGRTSRAMAQGLARSPSTRRTRHWERLEEALISPTWASARRPRSWSASRPRRPPGASGGHEELSRELRRIVADLLRPSRRRRAIDVRARPAVILVVGVNGTGKTTSIGKLAYRLQRGGRASWSSARPTRSAPRRPSSSRPGPARTERGLRRRPERRRPGRGRVRRRRGGGGARPRRRDRRHGRPPAHAGEPDGGAREDAPA